MSGLHPSSLCPCSDCRVPRETASCQNGMVTISTGPTVQLLTDMVQEKDRRISELSREVGRLEGENKALREKNVKGRGRKKR